MCPDSALQLLTSLPDVDMLRRSIGINPTNKGHDMTTKTRNALLLADLEVEYNETMTELTDLETTLRTSAGYESEGLTEHREGRRLDLLLKLDRISDELDAAEGRC